MNPAAEQKWSYLRKAIWPVHRSEYRKLLPMIGMFFLITFIYNLLRTIKDSLIITAANSGAEVIPFLKVWMMLPGAIFMAHLYTRLCQKHSQEKVFYIIISSFLGFFAFFAFILLPNQEMIHLHALADYLELCSFSGMHWPITMIRYWSFSLFYVMSELWSSVVLFTLFWGFASQIFSMGEAKRFYSLFSFGANFSGVIAGMTAMALCQFGALFTIPGVPKGTEWLYLQIYLLLALGAIVLIMYRWIHASSLQGTKVTNKEKALEEKKKKSKLSLLESFKYLANSPYMLSLVVIVISYNIVINLTEVVWKHQVREAYPVASDFNFYMNGVMSLIGVIATVGSLFFSGMSVRRFGWTFTALLTPLIILTTSLFFFGAFFQKQMGILFPISTIITPGIVVFLGSVQNILSRGAKYTIFDMTKELAFVPLDPIEKIKGKAAIDGVCSRVGKSGGALVYQILLLSFADVVSAAPVVAIILLLVIIVWVGAVRRLGGEFEQLSATVN